jgi:small subunit ribosomal protein S1
LDNGFGQIVLSYEKAKSYQNELKIKKSMQSSEFFINVTGKSQSDRGVVVDFNSTECFMPYSLSGITDKSNLPSLVNQKFDVKVVKYQPEKNNILVSRKYCIDQESGVTIKERLNSLSIGDKVKGRVKSHAKFGVFVDLGFMDSLVHINEISWKHVSDTSEILKFNNTYDFIIIDIDKEKERVLVSYKETDINPWLNVTNNYSENDTIDVTINKVDENGIFVRYKDEMDFYIHKTELTWHRILGEISSEFSVGQELTCKIKEVKNKKKSLFLSLKEASENPIDKFENSHKIGDEVDLVVKSVNMYDLRVLCDDVSCFIGKEDLSWSRASLDKYSVGEKLKGVFKSRLENKIFLSIKQDGEDPLNGFRTMKKGDKFEAVIKDVTDKKVYCFTKEDLNVFINIENFENKNWTDFFDKGDVIELYFDKIKTRNIVANYQLVDKEEDFKNRIEIN